MWKCCVLYIHFCLLKLLVNLGSGGVSNSWVSQHQAFICKLIFICIVSPTYFSSYLLIAKDFLFALNTFSMFLKKNLFILIFFDSVKMQDNLSRQLVLWNVINFCFFFKERGRRKKAMQHNVLIETLFKREFIASQYLTFLRKRDCGHNLTSFY